MSRRLLHITDSLGRTGVASQVLVLSRGLVDQGFDVHVVALDGGRALAKEFRESGVSTTTLGRRWKFEPIVYWKLRRLVRRLRPEVVHTWNSDAGLFGRVAAWAGGVRNVVAGLYRIEPLRGYGVRLVDRKLAERTPRMVTSSAHIRDW